jgi:hypothetical protein
MSHTFAEAEALFLQKAEPDYNKTPSEKHSSARMGGWIIFDVNNMMIGWVGKRGDVRVYNYEDRPVKKLNKVEKN